MPTVLVVDDEPAVRESLRMLLKREYSIETAESVDTALRSVSRCPPDLILLDVVMPERNGLDLLAEFRQSGIEIPVVVLTATNTVAVAVEAMKMGAADFVTKPFELEPLRLKVAQIIEHQMLEQEVVRLRDEVRQRHQLGRMVGRSPAIQEVFRTVERLAKSSATVLISGESGTGKELAARAIHDLSARSAEPFIPVNCGAIPRDLIESELFGHEKGAFTGAGDQRIGRFEAAHRGTLFLDEIGELEANLQVKLLRALQERVVERVGSTHPVPIDVRILAATNRDLEAEVEAGRFRSDLYYRVNVVPLVMPPLRERREDVALLAETFLGRATRPDPEADAPSLSDAAHRALLDYGWPGNVRELENAIEHGIAMSDGPIIDVARLPLPVRRSGQAEALREEWRQGQIDFEQLVARFETEILREALERQDWNQTRTAASLGITRRILKLKIDKLGIGEPG
ncbi:MAG: sigma-54 dependent transcriptional regulator [Myxococcota bacterium]|jgi:two-component system, NtrC family, response regulator AtoC|nr:sigma-54 dependent transcriptional regulator [Myxococcota bacterium]